MNLSPATKVHLLAGSTDMRTGFDGLFALAKGLLQADPLSGHLFGFCNKGRNRLKILYWDGSGYGFVRNGWKKADSRGRNLRRPPVVRHRSAGCS